MSLGRDLGVNRTPTLIVSKGVGVGVRINRWGEFEGFQEVIDRLLEEDAADGD